MSEFEYDIILTNNKYSLSNVVSSSRRSLLFASPITTSVRVSAGRDVEHRISLKSLRVSMEGRALR